MSLTKTANKYRARSVRATKRAERLQVKLDKLTEPTTVYEADEWPDDPAGALAAWAAERLVIPPGHPNAGAPLVLPDFAVGFLRDALQSFESLLCIGRKNAKSAATVAVYLLGRLVGPLRTSGYRAGVCSVNKDKAQGTLATVRGNSGGIWA